MSLVDAEFYLMLRNAGIPEEAAQRISAVSPTREHTPTDLSRLGAEMRLMLHALLLLGGLEVLLTVFILAKLLH